MIQLIKYKKKNYNNIAYELPMQDIAKVKKLIFLLFINNLYNFKQR